MSKLYLTITALEAVCAVTISYCFRGFIPESWQALKPAGRAFVLNAWLSMPYPTPPPEPPSIIQTVAVPESPSVEEARVTQKAAKKQLLPSRPDFDEERTGVVSSPLEAIADTTSPQSTLFPSLSQTPPSHVISEVPAILPPTAELQLPEPQEPEPKEIEATPLVTDAVVAESMLPLNPTQLGPATRLSHSKQVSVETGLPMVREPLFTPVHLNLDDERAANHDVTPATIEPTVTRLNSVPISSTASSSQRPLPLPLSLPSPSLSSAPATKETGLQLPELEAVHIAAKGTNNQVAITQRNDKSASIPPTSLPSWAVASARTIVLSRNPFTDQDDSLTQTTPLPQVLPRPWINSLSSQSFELPLSLTASVPDGDSLLSTLQSNASNRLDASTQTSTGSLRSASAPIPPLSQVIALPSLASETSIPTVRETITQRSEIELAEGNSSIFHVVPTSSPIPPLSQVIPLPALPPSYPVTPIPVNRDVGLKVSPSERTDASFLEIETVPALGELIHRVSPVSTDPAMARLRFSERASFWQGPLTEAILASATQQAQIIEPDTVVPDSDVDADASDRPIPDDELEGEFEELPSDDFNDATNLEEANSELDNGPSSEFSNESSEEPSDDSNNRLEESVNGSDDQRNDELDDELDAEDTAPPFPRAASPEPFWNNGAFTNEGILLTPSEPTNRPATPLRLTADFQEFEPLRQVVTARGNVLLQLGNGALAADRLWANLFNRYVLVDGNVVFRRGEQIIEGERGEYNLLQGQGSLFDTRGTLFIPDIGEDFATITSGEGADADPLAAEDVRREDPLTGVVTTGGLTFGTGNAGGVATTATGDGVRRVRFEATQIDFDAEGWVARDVRLTNDPFSPPELEIRGDTATLTPLNAFEDELVIENPRLVFDQGFSLPLLRSRYILRRGDDNANPLAFGIGFDGEDRGGLFIERTFTVATTPRWDLRVTPQLLVQRLAREDDEGVFASNFGLVADLNGQLSPTTTLRATVDFSGLDLDNFEDRLRASVRLRQQLGRHTLNWEYSYRDRLFNGSLGFQNVQSSLGAVLVSPNYVLGDTGIVLNYQVGAQYITALTDRDEFLQPFETRELVSLGRFQGNLSLSKVFTLWRGRPLPRTPDQGLRFTPNPVVPNIRLILRAQGTYSYYTNNDTQESLSGIVSLRGQLGHFSKDFLDSTTFNLTYRTSLVGDSFSPFLFDRDVDRNRLSFGIIQQLYGPIRVGFQTSFNLDTGTVISTDYIFEYSRRTYGVEIRVNPERRTGFVGFRLNDFGWSGRAAAFGGADVDEVEGGVVTP